MSTVTIEPETTTTQNSNPEPCPFPAEFLDTLQNTCFETLSGYLSANGAPEEALDMLDSIMCLGQFITTLAELGGKVRTREHQTILDVVSRACRLNAALGGGFYGSGFSTEGGEPVSWSETLKED